MAAIQPATGSGAAARDLFEDLADAYDCSAAISKFGKSSQWTQSLVILQGMQHQRIPPNDVVYNSGMTACGAQRWRMVLNLLATGEDRQLFGSKNQRIARNSVMSACTRAARWRETVTCLEALQSSRLRPDSWSYVAALGTVAPRGGPWTLAIRYLEQMQLHAPLELMALTAAISACDEWQQALALFQKMIDLSIRATIVTATAVISACARSSHWLKAMRNFADLPSRSQSANEVTRASAIRACEEGQQWQSAVDIFREKLDNVVLLNEAISCGRPAGNWCLALALLCGWQQGERRRSKRLAYLDEISLGAASSNCERAGQWEVALELQRWMQDAQGICSDGPACNMLVSGCGRGAVWDRALQLVSSMLPGRLSPNDISLASAISACGRCKEWGPALGLLRARPRTQLSGDTCGAAIGACETAQYWRGAVDLIHAMTSQSLEPDVVKCSSALSACQDGHWLMALALLEQVNAFRLELGLITCAAVLTACSVAQKWLQCLEVLQQMRDLRMAIDFVARCDVVQACGQSGLGQAAVPQLLSEVRGSLLEGYSAAFPGRMLQPA